MKKDIKARVMRLLRTRGSMEYGEIYRAVKNDTNARELREILQVMVEEKAIRRGEQPKASVIGTPKGKLVVWYYALPKAD